MSSPAADTTPAETASTEVPSADVAPGGRRRQLRSEITRAKLLEAALTEFAAHGFEATSTRAIAVAAETQQPQINYHFDSKESLWRAAVDLLFDRLDEAIRSRTAALPPPSDEREAFAHQVETFVRSVAELPELNRIMVHEATAVSDRLRWIVERHTRPRFDLVTSTWRRLRGDGAVRDIDDVVLYYVLIGAASLPYVNAAEARLLGYDTAAPQFVDAHVQALVDMLIGPDREVS